MNLIYYLFHVFNSKSGRQYFGEVHFVFWNQNYKDFDAALKKPDGLAVLGFFLQDGEDSATLNGPIDQFVKEIGDSVLEFGSQIEINLSFDFLTKRLKGNFFRSVNPHKDTSFEY